MRCEMVCLRKMPRIDIILIHSKAKKEFSAII
nr:MAG TPA_asm: hypothetical protein [Bacteriophage sp.]